MIPSIFFVVGAYLLGSLPHLSFLGRLRGVNLIGDFHQNLWNQAGWKIGLTGIVLEILKGAVVIITGRALGLGLTAVSVGGLSAVCGQMWPIFRRFDGEKGNSIALGMAVALTPLALLVALAPAIVAILFRTIPRINNTGDKNQAKLVFGGAPSKSMPLGMAACFMILPLASYYLGAPLIVVWCYLILFISIMLRRLTAGLRADLQKQCDKRKIILSRLLLDRSVVDWRA